MSEKVSLDTVALMASALLSTTWADGPAEAAATACQLAKAVEDTYSKEPGEPPGPEPELLWSMEHWRFAKDGPRCHADLELDMGREPVWLSMTVEIDPQPDGADLGHIKPSVDGYLWRRRLFNVVAVGNGSAAKVRCYASDTHNFSLHPPGYQMTWKADATVVYASGGSFYDPVPSVALPEDGRLGVSIGNDRQGEVRSIGVLRRAEVAVKYAHQGA